MRARLFLPAAFLALACSSLVCAVPPADSPIKIPAAPVVPPAPVVPGSVVSLSGDQLYVIDCAVDCAVRTHPAELVKVTKETGPIRIRGKFVDGLGKTETKHFSGPFVFIVEPVGKGRVELDVIPYSFKAETEIVSAKIDVNGGQGPIPLPVDPIDPVDPVTPTDPLFAAVQAAFTAEPASVRLPDGTVRTKALDVVGLAAAYRSHAKALPTFVTAQEAFDDLTKAHKAAVDERIPGVRKIAGAEVAKIMPPVAATKLTDAQKAAAAAFLNRFAGLLDQVK